MSLLTWERETFALANSFDEATRRRYRGLRAGQHITLADTDTSWLLVKPDIARRQLDAERAATFPEASAPGPGHRRQANESIGRTKAGLTEPPFSAQLPLTT